MLCLFVAADGWQAANWQPVAGALAVVTGLVAGFTFTTVVHEWFHYLGARSCGANFTLARRLGLQVFDWDYNANSLARFYTMSLAGTLGSITAIVALLLAFPPETVGRCALVGAACGSLAFAGAVEWPVLWRVRAGVAPLAALSAIDSTVLRCGFGLGLATTAVVMWLLYPTAG